MPLQGKTVGIFAEDIYNEFELWIPYYRFLEEGAQVVIIGSGTADVFHGKYGIPVKVDKNAADVSPNELDCIVIPGGYAPDKMRIHPEMVNLVRDCFNQGKIIAAICHAGWMLASAGIAKGKKCTSYVAVKDDLVNAGAHWEDSEVVVDGNLITSRKPEDLPAFCKAVIKAFADK